MKTLIHISDLHFGTEIPEIVAAMREAVPAHRPDLVVVSGDLTQRASAIEYQKAREFLQDLHSPWIAVPGNHDIPFYDVARRFFSLSKDIRRTSIKNSTPSSSSMKKSQYWVSTQQGR
jgi:3',5'-cyclic AMP phosphodiesterase CpdA